MRKMAEKMQRILSPDKIERYVKEQMGTNSEMQASGLPLNNAEDFIKIIYIRLYGQRKSMGYQVETTEEKTVNGYRFKDFKIRRKK